MTQMLELYNGFVTDIIKMPPWVTANELEINGRRKEHLSKETEDIKIHGKRIWKIN